MQLKYRHFAAALVVALLAATRLDVHWSVEALEPRGWAK